MTVVASFTIRSDPNTTGAGGETALMIASRTGRPEAMRLLIDRGADVNRRESWHGETALMWAAAENHAEAVALLASRGADLEARSNVPEFPKVKVDAATMVTMALPRGGMTALLLAARQGAGAGVDALARAGADLDAADPDGTTPLVMAIINSHYDEAARLVEHGAGLDQADAAGMTPLYAAIDMRHQEPLVNRPLAKPSGRLLPYDVIQLLLDRGQLVAHRAEQLAREGPAGVVVKRQQDLHEVHVGYAVRAGVDASTARRVSRSAGLTRWWSKPAARVRRRSSSRPQPVSAARVTSPNSGRARRISR